MRRSQSGERMMYCNLALQWDGGAVRSHGTTPPHDRDRDRGAGDSPNPSLCYAALSSDVQLGQRVALIATVV